MRSVAFGPISVHSRQVSLYWQCSITRSGNINISSWYLVHLGAGFWAAIAGPIFRKDTGIIYVSGTRESFSTFGWQLLGALAIFVWAGLTLFIIMLPFLCARCATYKDAGELFNSIFNLFFKVAADQTNKLLNICFRSMRGWPFCGDYSQTNFIHRGHQKIIPTISDQHIDRFCNSLVTKTVH